MTALRHLGLLLSIAISLSAQQPAGSAPATSSTQPVLLAAGVPLRIRVTRTVPVGLGVPVTGVLTEAVYVGDRLVLPKGALASGTVIAFAPIAGKVHAQALLNGDVTPLHDPVINFNYVHLAETDLALRSHATIRNTQLVRFAPAGKRPSYYQQAKTMVRERIQSTRETIFGPDKKDRALRFLYGQLPYHPQRIWAGTQFIADLDAPATLVLPTLPLPALTDAPTLNGVKVTARLNETLDSSSAKKGDEVVAVVTLPVFDAEHKLVLAEGAELEGTVTQSKPARSFGRNGQLRFAFRGVKSSGGEVQKAYGTVTAAEGAAGENITVDEEGTVKANPDKDRFVAPLLLAVTAAAGRDDDRHHDGDDNNLGGQTVASNGFGIVARVLALTVANQNVATGFGAYAFAKSVYFRFLDRGHQVTFPKDTEVEVQLAAR